MSPAVTESQLESAALEILAELGYNVVHGPDIEPESASPERSEFSQVVLAGRLRSAIARLNPELPADSVDEVVRKVSRISSPRVALANHEFHKQLVSGVDIEYRKPSGEIKNGTARLFDFDNPAANDWLAVNQFTVIGNTPSGLKNRRPDIVIFINGLPLGLIELKNPADEDATVEGAFTQLQNYKLDIPDIFTYNEALVISDGVQARLGTLTSDIDRFMPWRTVDGSSIAPPGSLELETMLRGVFSPAIFLDLIQSFVVFNIDKAEVSKKLAGYHQYHAVNRALASTLLASASGGNQRAGVIWHTQGSGKSLSMLFYCGKVLQDPGMENPTLIVLTDRNDLDDQLFDTFAASSELLRTVPVQAESKEHLRKLLRDRPSGGVIFTTIQKFGVAAGEAMPLLSERRNIVFIADEAHRSQYGLDARVVTDKDTETARIAYGLAKHVRDALPNASFIGFTGTPIEAEDRSTKEIFGEYIDIYDIRRSVEDKATVPIFYEGRIVPLSMNDSYSGLLDEDFEAVVVDEEDEVKGKVASKWAALASLVGARERLERVAKDIVQHFELRQEANSGKGMIVTMSRRIAVALYDEIIKLRPDWHSDDNEGGSIKVVMSASSDDAVEFNPHRRNKEQRKKIEKRFKNPDDPLKLVIVRDMWLTGFDVPPLHTLYMDKPMQGHGLMQAIARVNRVFGDKPGGLIVDYIGIADKLRKALVAYTPSDQAQVGIDIEEAVRQLHTRLEVVQDILHGFDYRRFFSASDLERMRLISEAMNYVLGQEDGKKRYISSVKLLSVAYALAVPHADALALREEVALLQAIAAALSKHTLGIGRPPGQLDAAVRQLVSQAVRAEEIVDVFTLSGIPRADIGILSDEFLAEMKGWQQRNLAIETLAKLINDEIKTRFATNVVQRGLFSEMLQKTLKLYQNRAIETAEVLELLIDEAREIRQKESAGEKLGLSSDEVAFYDALADNGSAKEVLGDSNLAEIARILMQRVKGSLTIDWSVRESARARLRIMVRRILAEHGYPPDKAEQATALVLQQAEVLSEHWLSDTQQVQ